MCHEHTTNTHHEHSDFPLVLVSTAIGTRQERLPVTEQQRLPPASVQAERALPQLLTSRAPEGVQGRVRHSVPQGIQWDRSLHSYFQELVS